MADMTDSAYCQIVKKVTGEEDYPVVFREMVSSEAVVRGNDKTLDMTEIHESERPLVQQLFGSDPGIMRDAAEIIEKEHHPEGFDINMGCPVYKITNNFNGCALMKDPTLAVNIIKEMKKVISVPLSVKIRAGWSDPAECLKFAPIIEEAGADLITMHGRTKAQGYSGKSDWEMIGKVKKLLNIPFLANGDIHTPEQVVQALEITKADGVLIARGALGNPWIFKQIKELLETGKYSVPDFKERVNVVLMHLDYHMNQYGERGLVTFRKHLTWYFKGIPGFKKYRERLHTADTRDELLEIFNEICEFSNA